NKAGLYVAVAEAAYAEVSARFRAAADAASDPLGRVEAVIDAVRELRRDHPHAARFLGVIEQDVAPHPELAQLREAQERLAPFWPDLLGRGGAARALAVRSVVEGFLRVGDENLSEAQLRSVARTLREILRAGLS